MDWYAQNSNRSYPFTSELDEPIVDAKFWCVNEAQPVEMWLSSKNTTEDSATYTFTGSNEQSLSFTFPLTPGYHVIWSSTVSLFGFCAIDKKD